LRLGVIARARGRSIRRSPPGSWSIKSVSSARRKRISKVYFDLDERSIIFVNRMEIMVVLPGLSIGGHPPRKERRGQKFTVDSRFVDEVKRERLFPDRTDTRHNRDGKKR
jgi:hypothetical protein